MAKFSANAFNYRFLWDFWRLEDPFVFWVSLFWRSRFPSQLNFAWQIIKTNFRHKNPKRLFSTLLFWSGLLAACLCTITWDKKLWKRWICFQSTKSVLKIVILELKGLWSDLWNGLDFSRCKDEEKFANYAHKIEEPTNFQSFCNRRLLWDIHFSRILTFLSCEILFIGFILGS